MLDDRWLTLNEIEHAADIRLKMVHTTLDGRMLKQEVHGCDNMRIWKFEDILKCFIILLKKKGWLWDQAIVK